MCVACKCFSVMAISMTYLRRIYADADFSQGRRRSRGPSNRGDVLLARWCKVRIHQPRVARMQQEKGPDYRCGGGAAGRKLPVLW